MLNVFRFKRIFQNIKMKINWWRTDLETRICIIFSYILLATSAFIVYSSLNTSALNTQVSVHRRMRKISPGGLRLYPVLYGNLCLFLQPPGSLREVTSEFSFMIVGLMCIHALSLSWLSIPISSHFDNWKRKIEYCKKIYCASHLCNLFSSSN